MPVSNASFLTMSVSGDDPRDVFAALLDEQRRAYGAPTSVLVDGEEDPLGRDAVQDLARVGERIEVKFAVPEGAEPWHVPSVELREGSACVYARGHRTVECAHLLALLGRLPFRLATIGNVHPEWSHEPIYRRTPVGLGLGHQVLESFVAFGGRGHDHLVSRRWLEHGPWRVHRGEPDVSLLQLHELGADPRTAFAQAHRGWERLCGEEGGYLAPGFERRRAL